MKIPRNYWPRSMGALVGVHLDGGRLFTTQSTAENGGKSLSFVEVERKDPKNLRAEINEQDPRWQEEINNNSNNRLIEQQREREREASQ